MANTVVGVDIGSASIRAVELVDAEKAKPTLVRFGRIDIPPGVVRRGEVIEAETTAGLLKRLWSDAGFKTKRVVLGMGNQRVFARDLTVPRAPLPRIRESLPFLVQEMLPLPVSETILDFYPTSEGMGEHGPTVSGLLIAAVKDAILANVKAVQLAGLTPVEVDLIPFALQRALVSRPRIGGTVALIDVGASTTTVVVAKDGVPEFVRLIPTGGDDLTTALSTRLELTAGEAEYIKRTLGLGTNAADAQQHAQLSVIYEVVNELLGSLRNTITYFSNTRADAPVERIVLAGGAAQLPGFGAALAEFTRLPVIEGEPFATIGISRNLTSENLRLHQREITVALGLAMGSVAA
ncbi:type IV pilus assembly protein PilM [Leifsonia sp. 2MCAF36]|uniref:type IV pilus assembly protein PilM n=1 Tax=Leifsonia sp. 2MCAF36 TaxID=3232988 RepID=UPI003F9BAFF8